MQWIFAHGDVDGISSAALLKFIYPETTIFFSHPHGLYGDIKNNVDPGEDIFIVDIALDETQWRKLIPLLDEFHNEGSRVVYIDHHILPENFIEPSFEFYHNTAMSTAELTYRIYSGRLGVDMSRVALYGAVGDYSDETDYVKWLYNYWDKRFIYFESGILTQGLEASRRMYDFKRSIVDELSKNELPSENAELVERALQITTKEEEMRNYIFKKKIPLENLTYIIEPNGSLGRAARYAYVYGDTVVGIAIEYRKELAVMSIRRRKEAVHINLNSILRRISPKYGGSGGGHTDAAGARIPRSRLQEFLEELDSIITR